MLCFSCPAVAEFANGQNLVIPQPILDFTDTAATHIHGKNLFHHISRFRVGDKVIAVVRVGQIAIWHFPIDALSPLGFGLLDSPDFQIIPAQAGKVFCYDRRHISSFHLTQHGLKPLTLEADPGKSIIHEKAGVQEKMFISVPL